MEKEKFDKLVYDVRGAIFEVSKTLGIGLFEGCYQQALMRELELRGIRAEEKVRLPVVYKDKEVKDSYELDILVEDEIIIELKSVETLVPRYFKQLNNYLHLSDKYLGLLVNFNAEFLDKESLCCVFNNQASGAVEARGKA